MPEIQKQNIGNAGEYYIASRLSAENFIATITLGRAENYDILALSPKNRSIKISVKTRLKKEASAFTLSNKAEKHHDKDFYYILVRLYEFKKEPEFWVIPSKRVCEVITESHRKWLSTPGKKGQKRNDTSMRKIPIVLRESERQLYPKDWEEELEGYYKNLRQLR